MDRFSRAAKINIKNRLESKIFVSLGASAMSVCAANTMAAGSQYMAGRGLEQIPLFCLAGLGIF